MAEARRRGGCLSVQGVILAAGLLCAEAQTGDLYDAVSIDPVVRSVFMSRHYEHDGRQAAWALGGWVRAQAHPWSWLSLELTPYTAQRLYGPEGRAGTGLLNADQQGITVLGEANVYLSALDQSLCVYRQSLDNPMLNGNDSRMIPVTYEAAVWRTDLLGQWEGGYVWKVKPRDASAFQSMSEAAGVSETNRGVFYLGVQGAPVDGVEAQLWDYYAHDMVNTVFGQLDVNVPLADAQALLLSGQFADQRSVGEALAGDRQSGMYGGQVELKLDDVSLHTAYTYTRESADIFNPWSCYFAYTSIMEMDNNLAGEQCWLAGASVDLGNWLCPGLTLSGVYAGSWFTDECYLGSPFQRETDLRLDWKGRDRLEGLSLCVRAGWTLNAQEDEGQDVEDYRVYLQADLVKLFWDG